jgi:SAM-dependent methyltransferase
MLTRLKETSLQRLPLGSREFFAQQKALIFGRPLLKRCYDDWYARLLTDIRSVPDKGLIVELGSGGSYLKALEPSIITSDVVEGVADRVIDARKLPLPDRSVRALVLTHVLHHVPDLEAFFGEAQRVLVPGGVITMIEVAHTPFARFFFKNFHPEPYLDQRREWSFDQQDTMMDSNQALSWMVFVRDRAQFETKFPALKIERLAFTPWFIYLASGGVTMRDVVPRFLTGPLLAVEWLLTPLRALFALHWHIRLRKIA